MQPYIWICLVDGAEEPSPRIRAWTADPVRAEQLRKNGLDMRPLFAGPVGLEPAGWQWKYSTTEEWMPTEKPDERDLRDYGAERFRQVYAVTGNVAQRTLSEAAVENAAQALFDQFCPGIRRTDPDMDWYRQVARVALQAASEVTEGERRDTTPLVVEALTIAEDVLSRSPYSTAIWPNGMHPQSGIEKIRNALASLSSTNRAPADAACVECKPQSVTGRRLMKDYSDPEFPILGYTSRPPRGE